MTGLPILEGSAKVQTPRRATRQRVDNLIYVDLGSENGGFPLNLTEHGMAFQGIQPLRLNQEIEVTLKLTGVEEPVTALTKVVWLSESRKGGALEFIDLPDATRELIRDWLQQQKDAEPSKKIVAPKKMSPIEGLVQPPAYSLPSAPTPSDSPAQPTAIIAAASPTTFPSGVAAELKPAAVLKAVPLVQPQPEKSSPPLDDRLDDRELANSQPPSPIPYQFAAYKTKRRWTHSYAFGVAASIVIVIAGGVTLWPLRGTLLRQPVRKAAAPARIEEPALVAPAPLPEELPLAQPSNEAQVDPLPSMPAVAAAQESQGMPSPSPGTNVSLKTPVHRVVRAAPVAPRAVSGDSINAGAFAAANLRLQQPAKSAPQNQETSVRSSSSIPETTSELPGGSAAGGKISALEAKAAVIPAPASGSVEIILDPYPSIRMPAQSQKRPSRPGTSLQIGRLISKVEPVYPAEALRQRIGGTVKAHVLIGLDGVVESSEVADAPAMFAEPALRAIRQLRFEPTLLGGTAIGVEEDITVAFRIAAPHSPAN